MRRPKTKSGQFLAMTLEMLAKHGPIDIDSLIDDIAAAEEEAIDAAPLAHRVPVWAQPSLVNAIAGPATYTPRGVIK